VNLMRVFAGVILWAAAVALPIPLAAQEPAKAQITVTGEATIALPPDLARIRAGVISEGKTAREASELNRKTMSAVTAAINAVGITDKDIQTARYAINPIYDQGRPNPPSFRGFQASNNVVIKVRDLDKIGDLIDRVVSAGANSMGGVEFSVAEPGKMLDGARTAAFADARHKAELYAQAAGVAIGRAVTISEQSSGLQPGPMYMRAGAAQGGETPIATGEITLRATVTVGFELK
jgi:uncharacterized protein YggE